MELLYPSLLLISFLLLLLFKLKRMSSKAKRLPPGPWQLPVIGSLHHLISSGLLPHRSLRKLSGIHGPIMHLKLGEVSAIIISTPDAAREILKTHDVNFASRPLINATKIISYGKSMIFAPYGEYWRQIRRTCVLEMLSPRRVQSFQSIREEEVLGLVRSISTSATSPDPIINFTQYINSLVNDIVMRSVIGSKCSDQAMFLSALNDLVEAASGFDLADLYPSSRLVSLLSGSGRKLERIHRNMDSVLSGIVQQHRERRAAGQTTDDDLLDALLRQQEGGDSDFTLTDDSIKAVILDIFGAGSETSATTLTWAMTELMSNPRVMKRAQKEIREVVNGERLLTEAETDKLSYLKLVIKETLRLHLPVPLLIPRECRNTCEVLAYEIPEKTKVLVNAWAMARDQRWWGGDAEEFRPERFEGNKIDYKGANFEFLPFGSGRRICPGMSFATATVEHALAQLLCYFDWELPEGSKPCDLDMSESFGATARKGSDLCLSVIPSINCSLV